MKIITICGSLKFEKEMRQTAEKMELEGNCVITPVYPVKPKEAYTQSEIDVLNRMHKEKIRMSDAILVVNPGGYIGDSTKSEIEYAKSLKKEVLFSNSSIISEASAMSRPNP